MSKRIWRRIGIYGLVTFVIIIIWLLVRLSYGYSVPPKWVFYILYNVGLLFNPLEGGAWLLALATGIAFIFFIVSMTGETITALRHRRSNHD